MKRRKLSKDTKAEIVKRFVSGERSIDIAKDLNCGKTTVYRIVREAGIQPSSLERERTGRGQGVKRFNERETQEVIAEYQAGGTCKSIATKYECCGRTIANTLNRNGIELRNRGAVWNEVPEETQQEIVRKYQEGSSIQSLHKEHNLTTRNVSRILLANGLKIRHRMAKAERHWNWKGGRLLQNQGYIQCLVRRNDPLFCMANCSGYVLEHRLVMARHLGRPLESWESVHHIDGDRTNNHIDNLQLRSGKHGSGVSCRCRECGSKNIEFEELD
ncbi:HNH endonuclease [Thalassoroseus pseudoceratinae]|uniref:HNH endonuclease n=1 Tax=Thalassoroseus pseudoceratinae TaxID=2713176 RepID=UPI001421ED80|nr:HNH endonuclease [Thalassoroseus pseudoceratinae]